MSKRRNISGGPLDVPLLNRVIEPGEVADCPDFQPASTDEEPLPIEWPADKWELVEEPKVAPELPKRPKADPPKTDADPGTATAEASVPADTRQADHPPADPGPDSEPKPPSSDPRER